MKHLIQSLALSFREACCTARARHRISICLDSDGAIGAVIETSHHRLCAFALFFALGGRGLVQPIVAVSPIVASFNAGLRTGTF